MNLIQNYCNNIIFQRSAYDRCDIYFILVASENTKKGSQKNCNI